MVNELRTLLLNKSGAASPGPDFPGEEYVPPAFRPSLLSGTLATVHRTLFGADSDRTLLNWRLRSYLGLLHALPFAEHVTAFDPRITYLPPRTDLFDRVAAGPTSSTISATVGQVLNLSAAAPLIEQASRILFQWRLDVVDGSTVLVRTLTDGSDPAGVSSAYSIVSGVSTPVSLPGSSIAARFTAGIGAAWLIEAIASPARGTSDIVADLDRQLSPERLDELFGSSPAEPDRTFRNLWEMHDQMPYRLGGLLLAVGSRLRELRG